MVVLTGQIKINCTKYGCLPLCSLAWLFKMLKLRFIVPHGPWSIWGSIKGSQLSSRPLFYILKVIVSKQSFPVFLSRVLTCSGSRWDQTGFQLKPLPSSCSCFQGILEEQVLEPGTASRAELAALVPASHLHSRAQQWNLPLLSSADRHTSKTHIQRFPLNVAFPPFWRLVIIPSWLFLLTAFPPYYLNLILIAPH